MSPERKGTIIPCRWTENRNGAGTNSEESDAINLEAESTGSRAESAGGCAKLVLQSDCVMADQPQNVFNECHICDQIVKGL